MPYNNDYSIINAELIEKKISILQEISSSIVVSDNITSVANLMLDLAIDYSNAEKGSLMLLNDSGELYILTSRGLDKKFIITYKIAIGEGIAGTVAENLEPVLVEDIETDERFNKRKRDRYKTRSFISCPIISKNRLLGVMNINDKKDGGVFTNDEFELIKIISNHAAIAIENAALMTQLKVKAAELEELNKKLIETDIMKTEFIGRISHELRTPMNSIRGAIYFLQQTGDISRHEQEEFYDIISTESGKVISIVENLIDFLRLEDEARIIKKTVLNIRDILSGLLDSRSLSTTLTRKNIQLKLDIEDRISDIVGDKIMVVQFFINLLEGLCHYLEIGDNIEIVAHGNEFVKINISLSRRMPESIMPYLADTRFIFQTEHSEYLLKLYLARKAIETHKWEMLAENADNAFQISIRIPISRRHQIEAFVNTSIDLFLDFTSELLDLNICSIMLSDELTSELTIRSAKGLDEDVIKRTRIKFGDSIAGWVATEGKPLFVENIETDPRFARRNIPQYNAKSLLSLPLKVDGRVIGVLNLNNKKNSELFTLQDFYIASALSERISHFVEGLYAGNYSEVEFKQFTTSFDTLINAEKRYDKKKNLLPGLTISIMDKLGSSEETKKIALYVSMIYDLGLMLINDRVLNKENLLPSEARPIKVHPYNTVGLLNYFEYSDDVKDAILHHHERYDGGGYPDGLKGEEIPLISRVLSVVDSYCAMIIDRPYRDAYSSEKAMEEIEKGSGSKYDPGIVKIFEEVISFL
ncbi:cyclic di-GMP phosphodiesterase response regulator RpfG [bacterium BMS3Abin07]|nr:cyclic di-GMP phosphodiesterase response regulator RpfG [bacterium BMS3Abin07]GBE31903.1 cyclic di-GMP phosphodiesterase response regulator RpfG [bacterium BMS3Bbin05]